MKITSFMSNSSHYCISVVVMLTKKLLMMWPTSFTPQRQPGVHIPGVVTRADRNRYTRAIDFFCLFFTTAMIDSMIDNTNVYGWLHVKDKPTYRNADSGWTDIVEE